MAEFLIELFSEEIPSAMQPQARESLKNIIQNTFEKEGLLGKNFKHDNIKTYTASRRLACYIEGLESKIMLEGASKRGPRVGAPEKAIEGFLKSIGASSVDELKTIENNGTEYYFHEGQSKEINTAEVITSVIPAVLNKMTAAWPKLMRWHDGSHEKKWIRPLKNIMCLFDGQVIEFEFICLKSNNLTWGHRLLSDGNFIEVKDFADYEKKLKDAFVILNHETRAEIIKNGIESLLKDTGLSTLEGDLSVNYSGSVYNDAIGSAEYPIVLMGNIDEEFLRLPDKVLIDTVKAHQRYFCLRDKKGNLSSKFIFVANIYLKNGYEEVIRGNEKVLRARLNDAQFFINEDLKTPLENRVDALEGVVFHEKLGTILDKVNRIHHLAKVIAMYVPRTDIKLIEKTSKLIKADLTTQGVAELPDLQGYMGSYYAKEQGVEEDIVEAIREHYLPVGLNSELPVNPLGVTMAIADKIDTLVGMFLIGEAPTSSKDPYALRRAALGIIRIIKENRLNLPLKVVVNRAIMSYPHSLQKKVAKISEDKWSEYKAGIQEDICKFFIDRLVVSLKEFYRHDIIKSVVDSEVRIKGNKNPIDIFAVIQKVNNLHDFLSSADNADATAIYKRVANILDALPDARKILPAGVSLKFLKSKEEKALYAKVKDITGDVKDFVKGDLFIDALSKLGSINAEIEKFFDNVTVNDEDDKVRNQRILLLNKVRDLFNLVTNFDLIEG